MLKTKVLKSLSYFDVFNHPLTKHEIGSLCLNGEAKHLLHEAIDSLLNEGICYEFDGYLSFHKNVKELVEKRRYKEKEAKAYFDKLPFYARIIKSFPFVRGIAISGSLSKNVMHEGGDIDYFIITTAGRLWICRTMLVLFKKLFLFNSRKYFCVNYFVDETNLEIIDKNVFTAIEVTHLAAVYNSSLIDNLKQVNSWTKEYIPNFNHPLDLEAFEGNGKIKQAVEKLFYGGFGDRIDLLLMRLTYKRWSKKFKHFDPKKLELTMRSNRGISKHHPRDFQNKVLREYTHRLNKLEINS